MNWTPEPRSVDPSATEVEMNGKVYHRAKSISIARWPYLERYKATFIHGKQAHEFHKVISDLYDVVNKGTFGDTAVHLFNLKNDIAGITDPKRMPAATAITMLFWNYEGEDVGTMSDELMEQKLKDAAASGIDQAFFFSQALEVLISSTKVYAQTSTPPSGSEVKEVSSPKTSPVL